MSDVPRLQGWDAFASVDDVDDAGEGMQGNESEDGEEDDFAEGAVKSKPFGWRGGCRRSNGEDEGDKVEESDDGLVRTSQLSRERGCR